MKMMQYVVFKEAFGRNVKKGHFLVFKDLDTLNCNPDNLLEVDRVTHLEKIRYSDPVIAHMLSARTGGKGKFDRKLKEEFLKYPELINLKRKQLFLNHELNKYQQKHAA